MLKCQLNMRCSVGRLVRATCCRQRHVYTTTPWPCVPSVCRAQHRCSVPTRSLVHVCAGPDARSPTTVQPTCHVTQAPIHRCWQWPRGRDLCCNSHPWVSVRHKHRDAGRGHDAGGGRSSKKGDGAGKQPGKQAPSHASDAGTTTRKDIDTHRAAARDGNVTSSKEGRQGKGKEKHRKGKNAHPHKKRHCTHHTASSDRPASESDADSERDSTSDAVHDAVRPTERFAADMVRLGLISAEEGAEWLGHAALEAPDTTTTSTTTTTPASTKRSPDGQRAQGSPQTSPRPGRHRALHARYMQSVGTVGLSATSASARTQDLMDANAGLTERDAATLALLLPWISNVTLTPSHVAVLQTLHTAGVDVFAVLKAQPATVHISVEEIHERLNDLKELGFTHKDVAAIVSRDPSVLVYPIDTDAFALAKALGQVCVPGSPEYQIARRSLWHRQPLRQVDAVDVERLRRLRAQLDDLEVGTAQHPSTKELRGRPRIRADTSHLLLRESPALIEAKLALLQARPLCLDLAEQAAIVRGATDTFAAMDPTVARERIAWLADRVTTPAVLRRMVMAVPDVLTDSGQLAKSTARLETLRVDAKVITAALSHFRALRAMLDPKFEVDIVARVMLLDTVLPRERWEADTIAHEAALLWLPFNTLRERLRLMQRLNRLDLPITETVRLNTQAFAARLGVRPAYTRFFAKRLAALQQTVRDTERVGRQDETAQEPWRRAFPPIPYDVLMSIPEPDEWDKPPTVRDDG
eukprot:m.107785 g.107785  ORF g.107785 m.107785 type:complete len:752 (-) comp10634_c1_seq3:125-2380(-)